MDGFGIHAADLENVTTKLEIIGEVTAGEHDYSRLNRGETVKLFTGAAIPDGVAAVVMTENVRRVGSSVLIDGPIDDGQNVRRRGEDVSRGEMLATKGTMLDSRFVAFLAAAGLANAVVNRRVRVGILSNGNELIEASEVRKPGLIYDANRPMLHALLSGPCAEIFDLGRASDELQTLAGILDSSRYCDLIVTTGGVSSSDYDHMFAAIRSLGGACQKLAIAMKPGKPLAIGRVGTSVVLSLPGNVLAAMISGLVFARPMVHALAGGQPFDQAPQSARAARCIPHKRGRCEFLPVQILGVGEDGLPLVVNLGKGGSSRLRPVTAADGLGFIPRETENVSTGSILLYYPFRGVFESKLAACPRFNSVGARL